MSGVSSALSSQTTGTQPHTLTLTPTNTNTSYSPPRPHPGAHTHPPRERERRHANTPRGGAHNVADSRGEEGSVHRALLCREPAKLGRPGPQGSKVRIRGREVGRRARVDRHRVVLALVLPKKKRASLSLGVHMGYLWCFTHPAHMDAIVYTMR